MADKNNYLSRITYQGGKDSYEFPFSYLRKDFVKAQIDLSERESNTLAYMVDYTIDGHTLKLTKPVDADKTITIYRETSSTPLVEYEDSSILRAYDLNLSQRQNLNILEEQTDIVGKNYSLSQETKDYMYKNLADTQTAINNKMSETLATVDSKLTESKNAVDKAMTDNASAMAKTKADVTSYVESATSAMDAKVDTATSDMSSKLATAQADMKKAVSDMNASLNETKQSVNASVSTMNDTVNATKKSVEDSVAEMNTTVANTKKSVEDSLATTTTNLNDAINTATSSMDSKIAQTSQALEDAKANLETTKSAMEKSLADTQASLTATESRVNETKADITKLADELKASQSSLQDAIKNISTTNRNTAYEVGDQIHSSYLPFNCYITCVTAGTTGDTLPVIPAGDHDSGFTFTDGTATFKMDYWPLSINGQKPLNKAGDITINVDKVKEAEKADALGAYKESLGDQLGDDFLSKGLITKDVLENSAFFKGMHPMFTSEGNGRKVISKMTLGVLGALAAPNILQVSDEFTDVKRGTSQDCFVNGTQYTVTPVITYKTRNIELPRDIVVAFGSVKLDYEYPTDFPTDGEITGTSDIQLLDANLISCLEENGVPYGQNLTLDTDSISVFLDTREYEATKVYVAKNELNVNVKISIPTNAISMKAVTDTLFTVNLHAVSTVDSSGASAWDKTSNLGTFHWFVIGKKKS